MTHDVVYCLKYISFSGRSRRECVDDAESVCKEIGKTPKTSILQINVFTGKKNEYLHPALDWDD